MRTLPLRSAPPWSVPDDTEIVKVPAADGQRFLISNATEEARTVPVTIMLNWSAAVKK
jgi:hypothetical protein